MDEILLEPELRPAYEAWSQKGGPEETAAFLQAIDPILQTALHSYGGEPSPVLKSHAKLIALRAARQYDPKRARLRTHLLTHLQSLRRISASLNQPVPVPEKAWLHWDRLQRAEEELRESLGREPSTLELADHSGLSVRRIERLRKIMHPAYLASQVRREDPESGATDPAIASWERPWQDFVYHDLSPQDRFIMEASLGLYGRQRLSKQQIAKQLGITVSAVSQRAARIQKLLDQAQELWPWQQAQSVG
jgi:DNA-directed RNA polymerase specialized sigma subunit